MKIVFECETNIGKQRSVNEDTLWPKSANHHDYADNPHGMLFIVADGMGGHGSGDVASELAVDAISKTYYALGDDHPNISDRLKLAIEAAHHKISEQAAQSPELQRMGTTVVAAVVKYNAANKQGQAWIAWVGDSRIYQLSARTALKQLTEDHSKVWSLIVAGDLTWEKLRFHPDRSKITNSLTALRSNIQIDVLGPLVLEQSDQLLLCSDGLTGEVRDTEIEELLSAYPPQQAIQLLIEKANLPKNVANNGQMVRFEGGGDNITAIIIEIPGGKPRPKLVPVPVPLVEKPVSSSKLPWLIVAGGIVLLLLLGLGIAALLFSFAGNGDEETQAEVVSQTEATPQETTEIGFAVETRSTNTPEPIATIQEPTLPPGETREPTATPASRESTPPPTATLTPTKIPITPTPLTSPTSLPLAVADIQLIYPAADTVLPNGNKRIEFRWQYGTSCDLPPNSGFELRVWKGTIPQGAMNAEEQQNDIQCTNGIRTFTVGDLQSTAGARGVTSGKLQWDVILVSLSPFEPLSQGVATSFHLAGAAGPEDDGSSDDGGSSGGDGGGGQNAPVD